MARLFDNVPGYSRDHPLNIQRYPPYSKLKVHSVQLTLSQAREVPKQNDVRPGDCHRRWEWFC